MAEEGEWNERVILLEGCNGIDGMDGFMAIGPSVVSVGIGRVEGASMLSLLYTGCWGAFPCLFSFFVASLEKLLLRCF